MARIPMVTRTFTTTIARVLCLNTETEAPETVEVILSRQYKTDKEVMKAVKAQVETETLKPVKVTSTETKETLYGMSEADFIAHAKELPPRATAEDQE